MKSLSKHEMKMVMGGVNTIFGDDLANCSATCTGCKKISCDSGTTSCSATDDVGLTCNGVEKKCPKYGEPGCL